MAFMVHIIKKKTTNTSVSTTNDNHHVQHYIILLIYYTIIEIIQMTRIKLLLVDFFFCTPISIINKYLIDYH